MPVGWSDLAGGAGGRRETQTPVGGETVRGAGGQLALRAWCRRRGSAFDVLCRQGSLASWLGVPAPVVIIYVRQTPCRGGVEIYMCTHTRGSLENTT